MRDSTKRNKETVDELEKVNKQLKTEVSLYIY